MAVNSPQRFLARCRERNMEKVLAGWERSSKEWERHYENMRTRLLEDWARTANEWERHYEIMCLRAERAEARLQELENQLLENVAQKNPKEINGRANSCT